MKAARRIRLIHSNAAESKQRAARLRGAGYMVNDEALTPASLRALKTNPPAAVVIDLRRIPSQGRDVAVAIRHHKATRGVPIVFIDGDPQKVARIKAQVPDAVYTTWSRIRSALKRAIANPPVNPVAPSSVMAGYSGTPLPKKLGIKPDSSVALRGAPRGFEKTLGKLPSGARLRRRGSGPHDLTLWFTKSRKDLEQRIGEMVALAGVGGLWIAWRKKSSRFAGDLTQADVRKVGLAAGMVDYKICAIDATWSGLKFTRRKAR